MSTSFAVSPHSPSDQAIDKLRPLAITCHLHAISHSQISLPERVDRHVRTAGVKLPLNIFELTRVTPGYEPKPPTY
jgi:hypothetical protein